MNNNTSACARPCDTICGANHEPGCVQLSRPVRNCNATLFLVSDGSALYKTRESTTCLRYRLVSKGNSGKRWVYMLYEPGLSPRRTMKTLRWFYFDKDAPEIAVSLWWNAEKFTTEPDGRQALAQIPDGSIPIGQGAQRVAWLTPGGEVAVIGTNQMRPNCPYVLQSTRRLEWGGYALEWFPFAETRDITMGDVAALTEQMRQGGWKADDWHVENVGRLADGTLVRLDPEGVERMLVSTLCPG